MSGYNDFDEWARIQDIEHHRLKRQEAENRFSEMDVLETERDEARQQRDDWHKACATMRKVVAAPWIEFRKVCDG